MKLSGTIDLGTSPNWEVGVCEVSCSSPLPETLYTFDVSSCADNAMIYCNLISPQFVGDRTVRCMRTNQTDSFRHHQFQNVHYVPVDKWQLQSIRVEFLTLEGLHVPLKDSTTPTNVVPHFRKNYHCNFCYKLCFRIPPNTFIVTQPLEEYYLNQTGRGLTHSGDRPWLCSPAIHTACAWHRQFFGSHFR